MSYTVSCNVGETERVNIRGMTHEQIVAEINARLKPQEGKTLGSFHYEVDKGSDVATIIHYFRPEGLVK